MKFKISSVVQPEFDMIPMIDVLFQLITFLLLINWFAQAEADQRVHLPKDQLATPPAALRQHSFLLNFGYERDAQSGAITEPTPRFSFGSERMTLEQIRPRLRQESQYYATIGTDLADVTVELRADAEIPAGFIQELIQMCQETEIGFHRFALKATQQAGSF